MTVYDIAKGHKLVLEQAEREASAQLRAIIDALCNGVRGPMGLTPDHVKAHPAYQAAKREHERAFQALRAFNGLFVKRFKVELTLERRNMRAA